MKIANIGVSAAASAVSPLVSLVEFVLDTVNARNKVEFVPLFIPSDSIGWQQHNTDGLEKFNQPLPKS
jgi:hypothetical protein